MKIISDVMDAIHLDPGYALLSVQNIITCKEYFKMLDIHENGSINDYLLWTFLRAVTDLSRTESDQVFHLLDVDRSGELDFEEFYFLFCIMIASKDCVEKEFIYRHSDNIFKILDSDGSGVLAREEFAQIGVLFTFDDNAIADVFKEFDIIANKQMDLGEFRLFAMASIDAYRVRMAAVRSDIIQRNELAAIKSLKPILIEAIQTNTLPNPPKVVRALKTFERPYLIPTPWYHYLNPLHYSPCIPICISWIGDALSFMFNLVIGLIHLIHRSWRRCTESRVEKQKRLKEATRKKKTNYRQYNKNKRRGLIKPVKLSSSQAEPSSTKKRTGSVFSSVRKRSARVSAAPLPRTSNTPPPRRHEVNETPSDVGVGMTMISRGGKKKISR